MDSAIIQLIQEAITQAQLVCAPLTAQDVDDELNALPSTPDAPGFSHSDDAPSVPPLVLTQQDFARGNKAVDIIELGSEDDELPDAVELRKADEAIEKNVRKMIAREARKRREEERKKKAEEARRAREQEEKERRERKKREKAEAMVKELRQEQAEREEREAKKELEEKKIIVARLDVQRNEEKRKVEEKEKLIDKLQKQLELEKKSLDLMREGAASRDKKLHTKLIDEEARLRQLEMVVEMKKEARIKATKEVDELPRSQCLRYSRECHICLNENPRRRVVMILCGHIICATCAEQLDKEPTGAVKCPDCRKSTTYMRIFEDVDETQEERQDAHDVRKRTADGSDEASSPKIIHL